MTHRLLNSLLVLTIVATTLSSFAQLGSVDPSYYQGMGLSDRATRGVVAPDSSVFIAGSFIYSNYDKVVNGVAKLTKDGTNDPSWNIGGADRIVSVVLLQPDGKVIIAGDFITFNGQTVNGIVRLDATGNIDPTFQTGDGFKLQNGTNASVFNGYLQSDGKIYIGGTFDTYNGAAASKMVRINPNGTIDNTFNTGSGFGPTATASISTIDRDATGRLLVGGSFTIYNGDTIGRIIRLFGNGTRDTSFRVGPNGFNNTPTAVKALPNGKVEVAGAFTFYKSLWTASADTCWRIARLNADASFDPTFNLISGAGPVFNYGFNATVNDILIQRDGKIIAIGNFANYKGVGVNRVVRIDTTGAKDATFIGGALNGSTPAGANLFIDRDSTRFYATGFFSQVDSFSRLRLARLLPNGKVDQTFYRQSRVNNPLITSKGIVDVRAQSTGKAIISGTFTRFDEKMANRIARLNLDGTLDQSFLSGTGANANVECLYVLPDDKILIGGSFTMYNGRTVNRIARLNADGSLDTTFKVQMGATIGVDNVVYAIAVNWEGVIYLGGAFTTVAGTPKSKIVALNQDGSIHANFNIAGGFTSTNSVVYRIVIQSNQKILVGGNYTAYNSASYNRIMRLDSLGAPDPTFLGTGASDIVYAIHVQADGEILIGGQFTSYWGSPRTRIARLKPDGTLSTGFTYVAGFSANVANGVVYDIIRIGNNVIVGGTFTTVNGVPRSHIAFLDAATGTTSTDYEYFSGAEDKYIYGNVYHFYHSASTRKMLVVGNFLSYNERVANRLTKIATSRVALNGVATLLCPNAVANVYFCHEGSFGSNNIFNVELSDSAGKFAASPQIVGSNNIGGSGCDSIIIHIPNNQISGSKYRLRITSSNPSDTSNVSPPIFISSSPTVTIDSSGPTDICANSNVVLTAPSSETYFWTPHGETTQSITINTAGTYTVSVTLNNCSAGSNPVVVSVRPAPDSSVTLNAVSVCDSGIVTLTAFPNLIYQWQNGSTSQSITATQSGTYCVTVANNQGCTSDSCVVLNLSNFVTNLITPNGPTTFCQGGSVSLAAPNNLSYSWTGGATTQSIVVNTSGTFTVTVDDGTCQRTSNPVTVTVNPLPNVTFSIADTTCGNIGNTVQLSATPSGGTFSGNGVTGTTFAPQNYVNSRVIISYAYTDANTQCARTVSDSTFVEICPGISDLSSSMISVSPNPAHDYLSISSSDAVISQVAVLDLLGRSVIAFNNGVRTNYLPLDITTLAPGAYLLKIGERKFKFIKE